MGELKYRFQNQYNTTTQKRFAPMRSFQDRETIVKFMTEKTIRILNLCHIPEDGRLKTLSFSTMDKDRIKEILEYGERVDGSNLFSLIEPDKSDIYILPRIDRTFVNPFSGTPTLNVLCDYLDENGKPLDVAPQSILARAEEKLRNSTDITLKALAELEFYLIAKEQTENPLLALPDKNYHESAPFTRFEDLRNEVLTVLADVGVATKYGHTEVGRIVNKDGTLMEQHEIELAPQGLQEMAENITTAKWVIRNVCATHSVSTSFSPKITLENAGSGMHVHLCALGKGKNVIVTPAGTLSKDALRMIGGILRCALSLSAFGNPAPVSYLRFLAQKESPMHMCWSARNRLALVRIPLWWGYRGKSEAHGNCRETFEYRGPDALANPCLLFAGIATAVNWGLNNGEEAMKIAEDLHVNASSAGRKILKALPRSCFEAAKSLRKDRRLYEADGVFPEMLVDKTIQRLEAFKDVDLWRNLAGKPEKLERTLEQYLFCG
jgi:glutamine synthetase